MSLEEEEVFEEEEFADTAEQGRGGEEQDQVGRSGVYNATEVNDSIFEELVLDGEVWGEVQASWATLLRNAASREAAGEAIYAALFDAAPSLQSLFKTPRAVMAMRFMQGLNTIIGSLSDPKALKVVVETLGFQHLDLEVTPPRVVIFRDAIVDLLQVELGAQFTKRARDGWCTFLNYVGGSYIYVRVKFTDRLKILQSSWATANKKEETHEGEVAADEKGGASAEVAGKQASAAGETGKSHGKQEGNSFQNTAVPTTYKDMFLFNAAVMGFKSSTIWMNEVLLSFDTIVTNVSNSYRLQEECDVLSLRIAKYKGTVNLAEYKAVMLASLRSLVPKDWDSNHEVSWSWLWENVERMIKSHMGKPAAHQKALEAFIGSLDENALNIVRREVYARFFALAPAGQDYFKQSTTRLYFIADLVVAMTVDMFKDPKRMVEDISALGLRHVGYGIPTELFGAFVTGCVEVVRSLTDNHVAEEAFRWSLSLISRILTRVITEGSTIVMKAVTSNSAPMLRKAVGCAPRGKRAEWMLNIQVGTQSISPLFWSVETGSLEAARAMIVDLLAIRADRDRYYYGMDQMFQRHPDLIKKLCADARELLPVLLDRLIWRSRTTENGMRRVNYYIKHMIVDEAGGFSPATEWLTDNGDPQLVCHPVISLVTDMMWTRVAARTFLIGRMWFICTLTMFVLSQSILAHTTQTDSIRIAIAVLRCFIYVFSMGQFIISLSRKFISDIKANNFVKMGGIKIPAFLNTWQDKARILLTTTLVIMLCLEPILYCLGKTKKLFGKHCDDSEHVIFAYSVLSALATILYFILTVDIAVFSTRVSAFVLVCSRLLSEVGLFLCGLAFLVFTFAVALSALEHGSKDFAGIPRSAMALMEATLGMVGGEHYDALSDDPALLFGVIAYVISSVIFLINLLIAQLSCAYAATYQDMLGFARLNRGKVVTETMVSVSKKRWASFVESLRLDERVEFGEGDLGLAGGIQIREVANANVTTVDMIKRFGGSTSPAAQWPEEATEGDQEDRLDRIEKSVERAMKRMTEKSGKGGSKAGGSSMLQSSASGQDVSSSAGGSQSGE